MKTHTLIFCFAAAIFTAQAQQTPGQRPQGFGAGDRVFPALNRVLTDEQRKSFRAAIVPQLEKVQPLEGKIIASRKMLLDEIAGGKFDEAAARQSAEESAKAEAELTVIYARALSQMQPPLSAAQIQQLKNFQPGQFQQQAATQTDAAPPEKHLELPPPLPRDSNDLPVVAPQK